MQSKPAWPPLVAAAGWLIPGAGYWIIGERSRGLAVGITVLAMFVMGLLIGGARALEVPGYGPNGLPIVMYLGKYRHNEQIVPFHVPAEQGTAPELSGYRLISAQREGPVMLEEPFNEIRDKPWSIAEVMNGPIAIAAGAWSVEQSHRVGTPQGMLPIGARSHARLNEIGILYMAVAGMLNLMVIIDAAYRAAHPGSPGQGGQA